MLHHFWSIRLLLIIWPLYWSQGFDTDRYKVPEILYCSNLKMIFTQTQTHNHTVTRKQIQRPSGNLGKMEHSWSACLGSFAHSSPHIGKLHDGQQYSPVTGLRKKLVSPPLLTFSDFIWTPEACEATGGGVVSWPNCCWLVWEHLVRIISTTNYSLKSLSIVSLWLSLSLSPSQSLSLFLTSSRGLISRLALRYRPSPGSLATSKHVAMMTGFIGSESGHGGL